MRDALLIFCPSNAGLERFKHSFDLTSFCTALCGTLAVE